MAGFRHHRGIAGVLRDAHLLGRIAAGAGMLGQPGLAAGVRLRDDGFVADRRAANAGHCQARPLAHRHPGGLQPGGLHPAGAGLHERDPGRRFRQDGVG
ncbi:hypothetical protein G6F31_021576 [Rhizopus arrhizus]|nr:hypothetical protein G6F31_021576 [Rhizopus arrhizus]